MKYAIMEEDQEHYRRFVVGAIFKLSDQFELKTFYRWSINQLNIFCCKSFRVSFISSSLVSVLSIFIRFKSLDLALKYL